MEPQPWLQREKYNLTNDERNSVMQFLLKNLKDPDSKKLKYGAMEVRGGNTYKLAHMGKSRLLKSGQLPTTVKCSDKALEQAYDMLK